MVDARCDPCRHCYLARQLAGVTAGGGNHGHYLHRTGKRRQRLSPLSMTNSTAMNAISVMAEGKRQRNGGARHRFFHRFANPGQFMRLSGKLMPWLAGFGLIFTVIGLAWGLFFAPADWQQGDAVRIMYIHVPTAWLASAGYFALALCSLASLVWRHPLADLAAAEIGPVGAGFTAMCLITGSLWGKPMWGAWWVWDARLTSVLVSACRCAKRRQLSCSPCTSTLSRASSRKASEPATLARVRSLRTDIVAPLAASHGGRLFKTTGDGFLAAFASAVQALRCAIAIQERLRSEPDGLRLRIGVHQGEVVAEGDDLLGDGVIIAARLEPLAEPGGICISARVREDAAGKLPLEVEDIGEPALKNIATKIRVFRVRLGTHEAAASQSAQALSDKPSIAVLAFTNMSGDEEQEYFSDGIAEDIITLLSRSRELFVIARNSSFTYKGRAVDVKQIGRELGVRYVLEGSVRRAGERVRITSQLVKAETGNHIWAERYDRALTDVFAVQDEISDAVATAVGPAVSDAEMHRAMRRPPTSLGAWELYQQGMWHLGKVDATANEKARCLFERAIERDPMFAAAYVGLSLTFLRAASTYITIPMDEAARLTSVHLRKAVDLDAGNGDAQALLAGSLSLQGDMDNAFARSRQILAINPNCAQAHWCMGES